MVEFYTSCDQHCNCTQQVPNVYLDPTTRAGASCLQCGKCWYPNEEVPLFISDPFTPSE